VTGAKASDRLKQLAEKYKALSAEEKQVYVDKTAQDKERYEKEISTWRAENPKPPKRPLSAYMLWAMQERPKLKAEQPNLAGRAGFVEMARLLGQRWKELPLADKKPFEQQAALAAQQHKAEVSKLKDSAGEPHL